MVGAAAAVGTPAAIATTALLLAPNATCCSSSAFRSQAHQLQARSLTVSCQHHRHRPYQPTNLQEVICAAYTSCTNEFSADPIDVVAKVQTEKMVVLGGSGLVGSAVCKAAVGQGIDVVSLSRSGRPSYTDAWVDQVVRIAGDGDGLLNGATDVVSTIQGFVTNEQMEQLNGEANLLAINAASNAGGKARSKSNKRSNQKELVREKEEEEEEEKEEEEEEIYDWPRLICCFGEAMNDFVPTVRVSNKRQHPDKYSTWKMLQWKPPEFARILGGPSFNTAIALARQGCRVALIGKVGDDEYGRHLVHTLNTNRVQTRGVRFDPNTKTGMSELGVSFENGQARMSCVQPSAENSLFEAEINADILKEATMFHFTSSILSTEPIRSSLFSALRMYKSSGGDVFFDLNLPLPLWISREHTWSVIKDAWLQANFIEVTKHELEFLLGDENIDKRLPQYAVDGNEPRPLRDEYHYTPREVAPLWHENLKMLFVTDGTYVIHYYALNFNGKVLGVEDVIIAAYTCDRAGSADAIVAGIIRKLNLQPELYTDEVTLPKALRYAMSAGVIAQWTPGSTKGLPTESAAQNLTEQVYHPVFVQSLGTELYSTVSQDYLL
ncbi:hypothetical protein GOP47_0001282 [Adiantum capillus-veneris]|uniref:Carbohydrate kinase PfkB domain-containing protein n=1 Tax=Adiantum capillus-veneris TaxID=13818 RepID=A0A9D4V833_ADICA|nr:hypothetical protein GOP47_0001282 [Adiantum capillus-veneris]